ncbi:NUDIX hydrolase [Mucilaginibacter arboris]|uniref:NUDIX domain-containing protein n=1 Tax=Mucilaginibacter arboris TaxID=2682090 RepID=A0A7K1T0Y2_9SPHI|nr:NUDIX domain-containing protein [Mucilaginibacter arboris]MVN23181.1 NUDIX domain-containing protein [Mucilaginibacter arboris]
MENTIFHIYINEKLLVVAEAVPPNLTVYQDLSAEVADLKNLYRLISASAEKQKFLFLCKNAKSTLKKLAKSVRLIEAAGGLVRNERKEYLVIFRNGVWDLPKGKIEEGEKTRKAAVREVEEECGIRVKKAGRKICKTYHVYPQRNKELALKKTHWYRMKAEGQEKLKPQKEEGITKACWFTREKFTILTQNTYPSIVDVLDTIGLLTETEVPL